MPDEKKDAQIDAPQAEPSPAKPAEAPKEPPKGQEPEVDYKTKLEDYKRLAEKRQEAIERLSKAQARKTPPATDPEPPEEQDADQLDSVIEQKLSARQEAWKREQMADVIDDELSRLSPNAYERELIKLTYENELKPSGFSRTSIQGDLEKAFLIVNRERYQDEISKRTAQKMRRDAAEMQAAKASSAGAGAVGRDMPQVDDKPQMTDKERAWVDWFKRNKRS